MATDNNIKNFTAADIEKYHKGLLSARERHALEKAALEDPFLADALEGYAVAGINQAADLGELRNKLSNRIEGTKVVSMQGERKIFSPFLRAAAMIIVLVGAGLLVYQFAFNKKNAEVAQAKQTGKEEVKATGAATDTMPVPIRTEKNNPGVITTETAKEKAKKDAPEDIVATEKEIKSVPGSVNAATADDLKNNPSPVSADTRTAATGATGGAPVTSAPAKPTEIKDGLERSTEKVTDKNLAREEAKNKAAVAKKQEADNNASKGYVNTPDNLKKQRDFAANNRQADDSYYRKQQMNTFRGKVTDASNVGLPFANVTNLQDNVGTYTDANGNFILTSPDSVLNVQIRSLGYDNNNLQLRNDIASNKVVMQEDRKNLSEVVVSNQKPNVAARSKDANRKLVEPEPVDGWVKYDSYLANNLNVPEDFSQQKTNDNNTVQVSFEVDKNGEPVNIRVEKSLCSSCDKEAIRLIKDGPKWKRNANKKGRTTVTINF